MNFVEKYAVRFSLVLIVALFAGVFALSPKLPAEPVAVPVAVKITKIGADGYIRTSSRSLVYASPSADW